MAPGAPKGRRASPCPIRQAVELDILGLPPVVSTEYAAAEAMDLRQIMAQKQREEAVMRRQAVAHHQMAEAQARRELRAPPLTLFVGVHLNLGPESRPRPS